MAPDPSEDAVTNFISFTNTSRDQAISFLKANDLDSNKAINAYFENPTGPPTQVSPAPSTDDSFGDWKLKPQANDHDPIPVPPSRPPSASHMRDTQTELPALPPPAQTQDTKAGPGNISLAEQEERQLQQAVAMSLNQNLGQQESGVTGQDQKFGRATRDHYEQDDWAMTIVNSSAREIVTSPDPVDRKKQAGEPAFIRPSQDTLYLGGLLTILHSIPLSREALLLRNKVRSNYGHDAQWWNGQPIYLPKIVTIHEAQDGNTEWDDILHESQRLIAFLDSSTRAFGSADVLAGLKSLETSGSGSNVGAYLEAWQEAAVAADPGNPLSTVFSSRAYRRPAIGAEDFVVDEELAEKEFFTLEPAVEAEHGQTLYEVLDNTMWADMPGDSLDDVFLEHVADVLTIQLDGVDSNKGVDVKIPAVFYPDRYLASCREKAREYRAQRLKVHEEVLRLQDIMGCISASKNGISSREILEKAAEAAVTVSQPESEISVQQIASQLNVVSQKIEDKLKELGTLQQEAKESLKSYSRYLTEPSSSPDEPPVHKYTLRGVCTEPHVTYVLRRSTSSDDKPEPKSDEYQWWRLSFSVDDAKSNAAQAGHTSAPKDADVIGYTARKVREIEVLRAAREESSNVLLVYANNNAMNYQEGQLPDALQRFVSDDNAAFETELQEWENSADTRQNGWDQTMGSRPAYPSPSATQEDTPASNVNVFDYQVPSFEDHSVEKAQEMRERGGKPLLGQGNQSQPEDPGTGLGRD